MSQLKVKNLTKKYGENIILDDISFEVEKGEFLSLLGPSGCGKTTILKLITGLENPDGGDIIINEKSILTVPTEKRNIGMVFQNYALFPNMTVFANVAYGLKIRRKSKAEIAKRVEETLRLVEMSDFAARKITKLSGGQQQRVALARALVIEPDILLLDEPLSALDRKIRVEMQSEIRRIQKKLGITTVFVTHDQEEAMTMSDRIILLNHGKIEQHDDPKNLYNNPTSVFASDFLGRANIFKGKVATASNGKVLLGDGWSFAITCDDIPDGTEVTAAIRGENIDISTVNKQNCNEGTVKSVVFAGALCKITVDLGKTDAEVITLARLSDDFTVGKKVYLCADPTYIRIFR